jgi:flavin reductase (DIM6/NTAB) family NADH-FMN oxidoreductase RutF
MEEAAFDCRQAPVDKTLLRRALGRFATGVMVVTTCTPEGRCEGLTANSFTSVSLDPPLVLWSLRRDAPSLDSFISAGRFALSILGDGQSHLSRHFATPAPDKFAGIATREGLGGCPVLAGCIAVFECTTEIVHEGGDHMIFIGRVEQAEFRSGRPLVFAGGAYGVHEPLPEPPPLARTTDSRISHCQGANS